MRNLIETMLIRIHLMNWASAWKGGIVFERSLDVKERSETFKKEFTTLRWGFIIDKPHLN